MLMSYALTPMGGMKRYYCFGHKLYEVKKWQHKLYEVKKWQKLYEVKKWHKLYEVKKWQQQQQHYS